MDQSQSARVVARPLEGDRAAHERTDEMPVGLRVSVRNRFDGAWCRGFEIAEVVEEASNLKYRIRRLADSMILPRPFDLEVLQPEV